ncbi:MAG: hypothetical protein KJ000_24290 [Pirellulaceae bacterium]|nr:hypothetical protein [Pirellulaceae bacterium]
MAMAHSGLGVRIVLAGFLVFFVGCERAPTTGGDTPVTATRLTGTRLTDIHRPVSWSFSDRRVTIDNQGQPIPADVVEGVLGDTRTCWRIEADWQLLEQAGVLQLSQCTADGESIAGHLTVPIRPAGHVRVNLGDRQYNMFRGQAATP